MASLVNGFIFAKELGITSLEPHFFKVFTSIRSVSEMSNRNPFLPSQEHVDLMKPGSVVVDLAAEAGGNIETTVPGEVSVYNDVTHIGLTDLPSRLPTQSSFLYGNNISKFLLSIGEKDHFNINLEDEVVRGSIILQNGQLMWPPPPPPEPSPGAVPAAAAAPAAVKEPPPPPNYFNITMKDALMYTAGKGVMIIFSGLEDMMQKYFY